MGQSSRFFTSLEVGSEVQELLNKSAVQEIISKKNIPIERFFAEATLIALQESLAGSISRNKRNSISLQISTRTGKELLYTQNSSVEWSLDMDVVRDCVISANNAIELIHNISLLYNIELFQILGMRNLSSFVGEIFAKEIRVSAPDRFIANPNQDGYPDLCALTPEGKTYVDGNRNRDGSIKTDKELWSHYRFGGIEVKSTCGNTPAASIMRKPIIGEPRLPILVSAEWKAHHQETRNLLSIYWDFVDQLPTVLAVFYRNDLDTTIGQSNRDWTAIIRPKDGEGRTTSVSIMKRGRTKDEGVKKMGQGWLVLPENREFIDPLCSIFSIDLRQSLV